MSLAKRNFGRLLVLLLAFVAGGSSNLFCVSIDADNDDETAPIVVELGALPASCRAEQEPSAKEVRPLPLSVGLTGATQTSLGELQTSSGNTSVLNSPLRC